NPRAPYRALPLRFDVVRMREAEDTLLRLSLPRNVCNGRHDGGRQVGFTLAPNLRLADDGASAFEVQVFPPHVYGFADPCCRAEHEADKCGYIRLASMAHEGFDPRKRCRPLHLGRHREP